jgi:hypothetical protein
MPITIKKKHNTKTKMKSNTDMRNPLSAKTKRKSLEV